MSSSKCFFLTCSQVSQEADQVVWYFHLSQNFPQFHVIRIASGFCIVNKSEIGVFFWNSIAFLMIQEVLGIWPLVPLPFLKPSWTSESSWFMYCLSLDWRILSMTLLVCEWSSSVVSDSATPWTVAYQAPPSMGFSKQGYWSGLPFPSPGIFPTQGLNPGLPHCRQMLYCQSHREMSAIVW